MTAGVTAAVVLPAAVMFHLHLTKAAPGKGETVATSPAQIRLTYSQRPELKLTSVSLLRLADSSTVALGKPAAADSLTIVVAVPTTLEPGAYRVVWRTASRDGHPVRGKYEFAVGKASVAPKSAEPDSHANHAGHR
jgi:methionine-rich copper-binding protein CopC